MTISSTNRVAGPYTGSGTAATFPFTFKVFEAADLEVVTLNLTTFALATLALTTDYTVALNADQDSSPGGSITLTAGNLATGMTLTLTTDIAQLQGLDLTNGGAFYPDVVNAALDLLTILVQQLAVQTGNSLQAPLVDGSAAMTLPPAAERAGKLLMFDSNGNPTLASVAPGGTIPGAQTATGTVNGVNRIFTFIASPGATPAAMVFAGGVYQTPSADYPPPVNLSGSTWQITFTVAPTQGPVTVALFA
jgi:hypothetical protein